MNYVLDVVDPLDRDSAFLQTAKAWQDLMQKMHHKNQTYEKYWSEYSALPLQYAYSHGAAAKTNGIQELLALLCVLNARLPRAELEQCCRPSEHRSMYSYVRLSIDRCTATYV